MSADFCNFYEFICLLKDNCILLKLCILVISIKLTKYVSMQYKFYIFK